MHSLYHSVWTRAGLKVLDTIPAGTTVLIWWYLSTIPVSKRIVTPCYTSTAPEGVYCFTPVRSSVHLSVRPFVRPKTKMGVWWFHSTTTRRRFSRGKYCRFDRKRWKWWWIRRCFILVDWWWRGRLVRTVFPIFNTVWLFAILIVQVICWRMKLKYENIEYIVYMSQFPSRGRGGI